MLPPASGNGLPSSQDQGARVVSGHQERHRHFRLLAHLARDQNANLDIVWADALTFGRRSIAKSVVETVPFHNFL